jgi:hypothetical protein
VGEGTVVVVYADPMVYVPDLEGLDEDGAGEALEAKGLDLRFDVEAEGDDPRVRTQDPPTGELVTVGTEVRVVAVPAAVPQEPETPSGGEDPSVNAPTGTAAAGDDPDESTGWSRWVAAAAAGVAVVVLAVGLGAVRRAARRRRATRLHSRLRLSAVEVPPVSTVDGGPGTDRDHTVRLVPHEPDAETAVEEEVRR